MGHTEIVDGKSIKVEEVNIADKDINKIYKEFGLKTSVQPQYRPVKRQSKVQSPYIRTIPLSWICRATGLPGKASAVGLVLWYLSGVSKSKTVKLTRLWLSRFGLLPETGRRGLRALERAKLVHVKRSGNKTPRVTLLAVSKACKTALNKTQGQGCEGR
ncbi:MAG: hypothetical protein IH856_14815 [Deltaproteobacteria bacterium]|nr:hypothetical protein [Deltaproteobacteria bacterium]